MKFFTVFLCLLSHTWSDEVLELPGLSDKINFKHYSGYLKASENHFLHYWLIESENNPNEDPFVVWMNGGPGCSSLGGLLSEQGNSIKFMSSVELMSTSHTFAEVILSGELMKILKLEYDGRTVYLNRYAWNKRANVLFLEAPAGVGFSYSTDGNVDTGDLQTAAESYEGLKDFFIKHPQYRNLDLYITGESYGGIYVPTLVSNIIDGQISFPLNLKLAKVMELTMTDQGLNVYDLYRNCNHPRGSALDNARFRADVRGMFPKSALAILGSESKLHEAKLKENRDSNDSTNDGVPICLNGTAYTAYLRLPEVRKALHIPDEVPTWHDCSDKISEIYKREIEEVSKFVKQAIKAGIRVLLYYGDTDMMCNFLMGQLFSESLNLPLVRGKKAWKHEDQIAGFATRYKGLDFLTVKGAGHMVPEWKPSESLQMIYRFIDNEEY